MGLEGGAGGCGGGEGGDGGTLAGSMGGTSCWRSTDPCRVPFPAEHAVSMTSMLSARPSISAAERLGSDARARSSLSLFRQVIFFAVKKTGALLRLRRRVSKPPGWCDQCSVLLRTGPPAYRAAGSVCLSVVVRATHCALQGGQATRSLRHLTNFARSGGSVVCAPHNPRCPASWHKKTDKNRPKKAGSEKSEGPPHHRHESRSLHEEGTHLPGAPRHRVCGS